MTSRWARARRRVDRRVYRLLHALYRAVFPARAPRGRLDPAALRRVLVVRHDRLGDMAVTTPSLAFLHDALPHAVVDVVASAANAPLLDGDPRVARVLVDPGGAGTWLRLVPHLRAHRYDLVFSPIGVSHLRQGLFAALAAPGAARVTPWRPVQYHGLFTHVVRVPRTERQMPRRLLYTLEAAIAAGPAPRRASVDRWPLALGARPEGEAAAEAFARELWARPGTAPAGAEASGAGAFVAVNAWAAEPWRELGVDYGGALLGALARRHPDVPFVLTPPPGRAEEAGHIAGAAGAPNVIVHPPLPHVLDLVSLLRRAALVLTPDTANVHLAAAAGRPVLGLYTARTTDPAAWAPLGVPSRALLSPDRAPVTAIPVDAVLAAFDALWDETAAREPAARGTAASALSGAPAGPTPPTA